jgi:gamma-glutamyltranspeptidase/glutathione hydrolase
MRWLFLVAWGLFTNAPAADAARAMVVAAHPLGAEAGLEMLARGGSAVDAAIAAQLVLGLVEPQSSGIGGGAFLLHWSQAQKRVRSYDGRETAPEAAAPGLFLNSEKLPLSMLEAIPSGRSVGVPGLLRMLEVAHRRHGRLPWARLFTPAIRHAEEGFPMSARLHRLLEAEPLLRESPAALALYYVEGRPRPVGERIRNPEYAATLRAIARDGAGAFYNGAIAAAVVDAVASHRRPGRLSMGDLAGYRVIERDPVCGPFRGHRICSMGPPGGGVTVLQILALIERAAPVAAAPNSTEAVHAFSEAARLAYADRARYLADPAFVPQPVAGLLAADYLAGRAGQIGARSLGRAEPGVPRGAPAGLARVEAAEAAGTTHISVVDARGDAVALTSSIESAFGSRILVRGFLLNNELTDFSFLPESEGREVANRVEPRKRPRSAMSPTLVFGPDGGLRIVLGSVGGPQIINYVARTLVAMLEWNMDAQAAVALPNFGSRNGPTELERGSVYETLSAGLRARGHELAFPEMNSGTQVIERVPGGWRGGADPRRESAARGR